MPNDVIKHVEVNGTTYDIVDAVSGYIKSSDIPVTSVNGQTGDVEITSLELEDSSLFTRITPATGEGFAELVYRNKNTNKEASISYSAFGGTNYDKTYITLLAENIELYGNINAQSNKISNVAAPTANGDAANKKYVDDSIADLDSSISATTGEAISAITITDGKITSSTKISVGDANQNAFSNVKVGNDTVAADSTTDTLELVAGTGITLTADTTNDKITITSTAIGGVTDVQVNNSSILDSSGVANFTSTTITDALGYTPYNSTNPNGYITGGTNSSSNVTITTTTDTIYKVTSSGSVSNGSAASFTQGTDSYTAPILTFTPNSGTTGNLGISWTTGSFIQGTDSFTANTPTSVTLPTVSSTPTTVLTGITSAVAGAQTFTGTNNIQSRGANEF